MLATRFLSWSTAHTPPSRVLASEVGGAGGGRRGAPHAAQGDEAAAAQKLGVARAALKKLLA